VLLAGIGVTVSRGGWIATGLGLFVFFAILARYRAYRLLALVALLVIVAGAYFFVQKAREPQKRFANVFTPGQVDDAHVRLDLMRAAYRIWQDNFWFGVGPAHFDYRFRAYRPAAVQSRPYWVHNDYLNALADWGTVGGGIIGAALLCLGVGAVKTWKSVHRVEDDLAARQSDRAAHVLGAAVGLLTLMFHSVVDFNMQVPTIAVLAVVLMASLSSHLRFATDKYWVTPHLVGRTLATLVGAVAVAFLATQAISRYRAIGHLRQADQAKTHAEQVAALKAAYLAEPANADTAYLVGEAYRLWSWDGPDNWPQLAQQALPWFETGMLLNPYETYNYLRYGMCLDWLKRYGQAERYFKEALAMDPNNYYLVAMQGWHCLQKHDYQNAKDWLEKSLKLKWYDNSIANVYLEVVNRRLGGQD
jgi:hypothetical protein